MPTPRPRHPEPKPRSLSGAAALLCSLLLAPLLGGCADDSTSEFAFDEIMLHQECLADVSPMRPKFNTAWISPESVSIFLQSDARLPGAGDAVALQIYQPDYVRAHLGEEITLGDPRELRDGDHQFDTPPVARAVVLFERSCPRVPETFGITGKVVFEQLGAQLDGAIVGELRDAQVISLRQQDTVADGVSGSWDVTIKPRRPHQFFPPLVDQRFPEGPKP